MSAPADRRPADVDLRPPLAAVLAEDASVTCGVFAAVLAFGLVIAVVWFAFWDLSWWTDGVLRLAGLIETVLVLLAVLFHRVARELEMDHQARAFRAARDRRGPRRPPSLHP